MYMRLNFDIYIYICSKINVYNLMCICFLNKYIYIYTYLCLDKINMYILEHIYV